jgi:DNA-binding SARP family transcriptional activator/Tfp pilus assembly protein PilF
MEFRILGPVELWCEGQEHNLGSLKARCILAVLLLNLGTVVPAEILIARIWDTSPPPKARESLSAYVTRLRRALRQVPGGDVRLNPRAHGYVLEADQVAIDLYRFRQLRRQATSAAKDGDGEEAISLLREADSLWRGAALAGLPGDAVARIRHSLEEERRAATLQRAELELALGRHADLVGESQRLADHYPADEEFVALHMKALYRSGRQSDALSIYREIRSRLVAEQGTEPGPALSELHQRILRRDPGLIATSISQPASEPISPNTLPPSIKEFVGREEELALLISAAGSPTTVLITGMPGIGKTALALQAAHAVRPLFPGGQLLTSFHTHDSRNPPLDAAGALLHLLRMLDVPADVVPQALAERAKLWRAELARRRMIVILDDVADPRQVRPLLPTAAGCRVVITSRNGLSGVGQVTLNLGGLPIDEGVQLFTRIAGTAVAGEPGTTAEVVRCLGGHPLAIRLAARGLQEGHPATLAELLRELADPAGAFGDEDSAGGQIAAAFKLSYQALTRECQQFFRLLSLHPGTDITVDAAAALRGGSLPQAKAALAVLVDRHLLERSGSVFRFHDLTRPYANRCATREDPWQDRQQACDRLIAYYRLTVGRASQILYPDSHCDPAITRASTATPAIDTPQSAEDWLQREWRNVLCTARHAYQHERKRQCAGLTLALARWLERAGHWSEAFGAHTLALRACRELDDVPGIARTSMELSVIANRTGRNPEALLHAETAVAAYRTDGDRAGQADALDQIGTVHQSSARFREALAYHHEASQLYRAAASTRGLATALNRSGIACTHLGRYSTAMEHFQSALTLYRQEGDRSGEARTLNNLGRIYLDQGYHRDAFLSYQRALEIFKEIRAEHYVAIAYQNIGGVHHYKGEHDLALSLLSKALICYRRIGDLPGELAVLNGMGAILIATEDHDAALDHYQRAEAAARELSDSYEHVIALRGIADAHRSHGNYSDALSYYQKALLLAREISELHEEGKVLAGIAETVLQTQGPGAARIYWHQAHDLFRQLGVPEAETARLRLATLPAESSAPGPPPPFTLSEDLDADAARDF